PPGPAPPPPPLSPSGGPPPAAPPPLRERLATLDLALVEPHEDEDVADPAGGDEQVYVDCAREIHDLLTELLPRL
ncbi:MAG TPA: hypothetical protein PKA98_21185, partial [Acidimicrobiales bacterium]|nr:hypothetical protein [Acidimicrobiales bacterium]